MTRPPRPPHVEPTGCVPFEDLVDVRMRERCRIGAVEEPGDERRHDAPRGAGIVVDGYCGEDRHPERIGTTGMLDRLRHIRRSRCLGEHQPVGDASRKGQ